PWIDGRQKRRRPPEKGGQNSIAALVLAARITKIPPCSRLQAMGIACVSIRIVSRPRGESVGTLPKGNSGDHDQTEPDAAQAGEALHDRLHPLSQLAGHR